MRALIFPASARFFDQQQARRFLFGHGADDLLGAGEGSPEHLPERLAFEAGEQVDAVGGQGIFAARKGTAPQDVENHIVGFAVLGEILLFVINHLVRAEGFDVLEAAACRTPRSLLPRSGV